jgi:hypothetical protein
LRALFLPWPAILVAAALLAPLFAFWGTVPDAGDRLVGTAALGLLLILLQARLRRAADDRWAADVATLAVGFGSTLFVHAAQGSASIVAAAALFAGFLVLYQAAPALAWAIAALAVSALALVLPVAWPTEGPLHGAAPSGPGFVLLAAPWLLLAIAGWPLMWRRRDRRLDVAGTLAVAAVGLGVLLWISPEAPIAFALAPGLPFLAIPVAATLAWLRNRPATKGPPLAGAAAGLVGAALIQQAVASGSSVVAVTTGLVAFGAAGLLFPSRASTRGRLLALVAMMGVAAIVSGLGILV